VAGGALGDTPSVYPPDGFVGRGGHRVDTNERRSTDSGGKRTRTNRFRVVGRYNNYYRRKRTYEYGRGGKPDLRNGRC